MNKALLFLASLLLGTVLFVWTFQTVGWEEIKNVFLVFTGWQGFIVFGLTLLAVIIGTLKWKEVLRGQGLEIYFWQIFKPYLASFTVMFLAPILFWAGEIFRSFFLKEKSQISFSKAAASVIIDRVLEWTINIIIVFLGTFFFLYKVGFLPGKFRIIFGGALSLFVVTISFFYFKALKRESLVRAFGKVFNHRLGSEPLEIEKEIFLFFKYRKKSLWRGLGLSILRAALIYLRTWLLILFLEKEPSVLPTLSILGFTYLAAMLPIPAALGSHEAIQVFSFNSLGFGQSVAAAFTLIIRGAELILALIGAIILLGFGFFLFKNNLFNKAEKLIRNNKNDV